MILNLIIKINFQRLFIMKSIIPFNRAIFSLNKDLKSLITNLKIVFMAKVKIIKDLISTIISIICSKWADTFSAWGKREIRIITLLNVCDIIYN